MITCCVDYIMDLDNQLDNIKYYPKKQTKMTALERQGGSITETKKRLCTGKFATVIEVQTRKDIENKQHIEESKDAIIEFMAGVITIGVLIASCVIVSLI
jgi:hypothetical protein